MSIETGPRKPMGIFSVAKNITTDTDKGRLKILRNMNKIKGAFITIGIHRDEKPYASGKRVQDTGYYNEFGVGVPERSFLRHTFDKNRKEWRRRTKLLVGDIIFLRTTVEKALRKLGFEMKEAVQARIETIREPSNRPSTIARKPTVGDNPLIHTRRLKRADKFKVHLKKLIGYT